MNFVKWGDGFPKHDAKYKGLTMSDNEKYDYGDWINKKLDITKNCYCQRTSVPGLTFQYSQLCISDNP